MSNYDAFARHSVRVPWVISGPMQRKSVRYVVDNDGVGRNFVRRVAWTSEAAIMDTNTLLIIVVIIFLFGGFGWYGRGRWF